LTVRTWSNKENFIMWRILSLLCLGAAVSIAGAQRPRIGDRTQEKHQIPGGIEGTVKSVDVENKQLTIVTAQGREHTYTVSDDTMMAGPRGGKVRKHLKDPRFREGFPVTIVAQGSTATEIHFGFTPGGSQEKADAVRGAARETRAPTRPGAARTPTSPGVIRPTGGKPVTKSDDEEDEEEVPGKIKSFDPERRVLVLNLLNGTTRSFLLARDVPVEVGSAVSKKGIEDPALKAGATVTVFTEEGGHKVKEVKVTQHGWFRR
jgi:hypothetical protein